MMLRCVEYLWIFILSTVECHVYLFCYVFFFKQKTAYEMRISDWSSDVCSSDLSPVDRQKKRYFLARYRAEKGKLFSGLGCSNTNGSWVRLFCATVCVISTKWIGTSEVVHRHRQK